MAKKPAAAKPKEKAKSAPKPETANSSGSHKPWLFKKGESGNPSGRPAVLKELKEAARDYTVEALEIFVAVMRDVEAPPAARIMAADKILDRGYGKATQHMVAEINVIEKMGIDELREYLSREAKELGIGVSAPKASGRKSLTH